MAYFVFALILSAAIYYFVRTIYRTFSGKGGGCSCEHANSCALSASCKSKKQ